MDSLTAFSDCHWDNGEGKLLLRRVTCRVSNLWSHFVLLLLLFPIRFLAGWPGLAHNENHETWLSRIAFGVNFLIKLPPQVAVDMTASILQYSLSTTQLLQSVTPFFGEPASYEYDRNMDRIGDVAVKNEARQMMADSEVVPEVSIIFDEEAASKDVPSTNEAADKVAVSSTAESSESSN